MNFDFFLIINIMKMDIQYHGIVIYVYHCSLAHFVLSQHHLFSVLSYMCLSLILPAAGGEQHVPGVLDGKQFRVLHHLPHSSAGACRHQDEGGHATGL